MKRYVALFGCFCLLLTLLTGCVPQFMPTDTDTTKKTDYEKKLDELVDLLSEVYVDGYTTDELGDYLAEAAIQATGDRWSYYISAEEYASYLEDSNNEYVGIGVTVQLVNEDDPGFTILEVNKNGPAFTGGILPNDIILEVEGVSSLELGIEGVKDKIRGEAGTQVNLTILRDGQELPMSITRAVIEYEVVTYKMIDSVGYIKIADFQAHCAERSIEAIDDLLRQGATGLVFDVRFNPGGRKSELVQLLDYLLPEGILFRSVDYKGKETLDESDGATFLDIPMAVLVNEDSYSAAEFFAAALQEYEWATIVGNQTVGKGNYQQTFRLSDGSAVAVSTGHYSTPLGKNLEGVGVTPDKLIDVDYDTYLALYYETVELEDDAQLQAALEAVAE